MSFSQNVKKEILARELDGDCCAAAAYGFACFGKLFGAQGAVFYTELPAVARYAQKVFAQIGRAHV